MISFRDIRAAACPNDGSSYDIEACRQAIMNFIRGNYKEWYFGGTLNIAINSLCREEDVRPDLPESDWALCRSMLDDYSAATMVNNINIPILLGGVAPDLVDPAQSLTNWGDALVGYSDLEEFAGLFDNGLVEAYEMIPGDMRGSFTHAGGNADSTRLAEFRVKELALANSILPTDPSSHDQSCRHSAFRQSCK